MIHLELDVLVLKGPKGALHIDVSLFRGTTKMVVVLLVSL